MLRLFFAICIALILTGSTAHPLLAAEDNDSAADRVLVQRGLKLMGDVYVLPGEAEVQKRLGELRGVYRSLGAATEKKEAVEKSVAARKVEGRNLEEQRRRLAQRLDFSGSLQEYNQIVNEINGLGARLRSLNDPANGSDSGRSTGSPSAILRERYMQGVLDVRELVDRVKAEYARLSADGDVRRAFVSLNAESPNRRLLGPSQDFQRNIRTLERVESTVLSDSVDLVQRGGIHYVDVTLNGKVTRPMVFDTGASSIVLPASLAAAIGLKPGPNDPPVQAQVADGSRVEARRMTIPSVRVGRFTAQNVDCIVMPPSKGDVTPLLGQSFHRFFTYSFSGDSGRLTLKRVETSGEARPQQRARPTPAPPAPGVP